VERSYEKMIKWIILLIAVIRQRLKRRKGVQENEPQ